MPYVDPVVYPQLFADGAVDTYVLFSASARAEWLRRGCVSHAHAHRGRLARVSPEITSSHIHKE